LNNLELWSIKKYCRAHELDVHLIDSTLTYSENMKFLKTLETDFSIEERAARSFMEQYLAEHALSDYVMAKLHGETKLQLENPIVSTTFSLKNWTQQRLSNQTRTCKM
jgi:hypothetical protein